MSEKERIKIVRKAVEIFRKDKRNWIEAKEKWPLTYGFYGLLDYIEYGKAGMILAHPIRDIVEKVIRESGVK